MITENFLASAILQIGLLAQEEGTAQEPGGLGLFENPLVPIAGLFFLFYFIVLLPDRKRKREEAQMLSKLTKNDRIVTTGGIHGVVVSAPEESDVVTIRIDENGNARLRVNRSSIAKIVSPKESADGSNKESASDTKD
ncbi:MAG: preprotein translocase subunit YajC [Rubripirellula sp.]